MQAEIAAQNDRGREVNIGQIERVASVGLGAALVVVGLALRSRRGLGLALTGAGMAYRGLGGRCLVYRALGIHGASGKPTATGNLGVKVERSAPIDAPPEKLYAFWRDFRNLPIVMPNLERVEVQSDTRSHWVVKGPPRHRVRVGRRDHQRRAQRAHRLADDGGRARGARRLGALRAAPGWRHHGVGRPAIQRPGRRVHPHGVQALRGGSGEAAGRGSRAAARGVRTGSRGP